MPKYNTGEGTLQTTFQIAQPITAFAGIAMYNVIKILVLKLLHQQCADDHFVFAASSSHAKPFWECFQLCCYFGQETIVPGLYVHEITKILKPKV